MWLAKGFPWWFHLILTNFLIHGLSYRHFTEKDTEAGSGLGLSLHGTSWRQSPQVEPLAMTNADMAMVPSQTVAGSVALGDNSVGLQSFSSQRG